MKMLENDYNEDSMATMLKKVTYDLKNNKIASGQVPSLEYLAMSKIAVSLWQCQIKCFEYKKLKLNGCHLGVRFYETKILASIPNLMIPVYCKEGLESLIKLMGEEIFKYYFNIGISQSICLTKLIKKYLDNLCWNQEGTINTLKTATKIVEESDLSSLEKYELACDHCLKDKIRELQKSLSKEDLKYVEDKKTYSMAAFWSLYIKDETLPLFIKDIPARKYLRRILVTSPYNEVALQFIWETFANETWKKQVVCIVKKMFNFCSRGNKYNIALYFSKQMSQPQLNKTHVFFHYNIFKKLYRISQWNNVLPVVKYAVELSKTRTIKWSIVINWYCSLEKLLNFRDFLALWNVFIHRFKSVIEKKIISIYCHCLLNGWNAYKQGIIWKSLLELADAENRKKLIYSQTTIFYCQRLLYEEESLYKELPFIDGPKYFDIFLNLMLKKDEISPFKEKIFQLKKINICAKLIVDKNCKLLDKILINFLTKEAINIFKNKYFTDIMSAVVRKARNINTTLLTAIEESLHWCLNGNEREMTRQKGLMFDIDSVYFKDIKENFFITIRKFMIHEKWRLIKNYWKWILCVNMKDVTTSKQKLALSMKIVSASYKAECSLYERREKCHGLLKRFITSCFNQHEVKELKKELQHDEGLLLEVKGLVELKNLSEVRDLLCWCFSYNLTKIEDFKKLFMHLFGCSILFQFIKNNDNNEEVMSILIWFTPSVESAKQFKDSYINFLLNKAYGDNYTITNMLDWILLDKIFDKSLKFLNSRILGQKPDATEQDSRKRKIAQWDEPFNSSKRRKFLFDE